MMFASLPNPMSRIKLFLQKAARKVLGDVQWQAPEWIRWSAARIRRAIGYLRADPKRLIAAIVLVLAAAGGITWYKLRPRPHYVEYTVHDPKLTTYDDTGLAEIDPLTVEFTEAVAPLANLDKRLTTGIEISPAFAGKWNWINDKLLQFTPGSDWPVDGRFTVKMATKGFLAKTVEVEEYRFQFKTAAFGVKIASSEFYQDPQNPTLKNLVATVAFTHSVDTSQFEPHVSLVPAKDAEFLGLAADSKHFTVTYDKLKLFAYIHSAALAMPRDDTSITLVVDKGVRAARGGNTTGSRIQSVVTIPGRTSLRIDGGQMTLVDNARYEPEQVLVFNSSSPVTEQAFTGKVQAYLLPVRSPKQRADDKEPYDWSDESEIGNDILSKSQAVPLTYVASDGGSQTTHGFKFNAPVGRFIYAWVKDGVQGTGGYISAKPYVVSIRVIPYRQALTFLGTGALLPMGGDKKVGFLVRDVPGVEVEIGRVLPNQLQHLAPNMWDFTKPQIYGLEDQIVERFTSTRHYRNRQPGKPTYDSIDLGQYLQDKAQNRRGLFLLHIRTARRKGTEPSGDDANDSGDDGGDGEDGGGGGSDGGRAIQDTRLILVTDLGFIVKEWDNGNRDVFVQSLHSGQPVAGARVEMIGRNGEPVAAATTDATGRAQFAKLPELRREKTPLLILAQNGADFSFMPLRSNGRNLDLSRFETGGVANATSAQQLSTYLFTDRGIYRPGETTHLGMITRTADWKSSLTGLTVDVEISDPRGNIVRREKVKLSENAFDEITFATQPVSPTGTYQASAWLTKDERHRQMLGSVSFNVQEFEPDRMKVRLDLSDKPIPGWLTTADVKARVSVMHLFGEPASNRRVEGELNLSPTLPHFDAFPDYRFQIGEVVKEPYHETLAATITDDKGNTELNLNLARFVGRAYRLNVLARAFEAEGGRSVAAQNTAIVADAPYLVGVKTDGDLTFVSRSTARQAHWLAVNQQLKPVEAPDLTLEWVQRKYLSVLTQQPDRTYKYVSRLKETVRESHKVRIAAGGSSFPLPTQEPGDFILVLRNAEGAELNRLNYSVAGEANLSRSLERNAELQIQLDKPAYAGGDTISVSIRAPYAGAGLITVEREKVFLHQWFKTTTTSSVQRVTLPAGFEGNGYVSVQFLRDPASDEIFMSPLSYGVAPFAAELAQRTLQVQLTAAHQVKPGTTLVMHVAPAEASRVAVFAIDEGILQVARYRNPDPLGYFFQKRMLQVETTQILDLMLPEFRRFLALSAPGGDADGGFARHLNPFNRKHKPPVAWWSGIIDVGPSGRDLRYAVPDYFNGRLRIVAVAVNARKAGVMQTDTEVKGDFVLTPNVPVMVAPGDEFSVTVGVFNNIGGTEPVRVQLQVSGELTPAGASQADLQIADKREGVAEFRLKANPVLGAATLKFTAVRGKSEAHIEESISVRPAVAYRTQLTLGRFDGASTTVPVKRDLYPQLRTVEASVATVPTIWGEGLVAYLDAYPYPCTEQLVSKGFASLLLASRPEFGTVKTRDSQPIAGTLSVLQSRENQSGAFGLWASSPEVAEFPTVYAAHFLLEARDRGQKVPPEMQASLNDWLTRLASSPAATLEDGRLRAYAVYLLARQGIKPAAALANVEQELSHRQAQTWPTDLAAAYLASTYRLMQRNADADRIIAKVPWSQEKRGWGDEPYYGSVVHDAQLLYLLSRHFPDRMSNVPPATLEGIGKAISGNQYSSLSASYTLLALDAYAKSAAPKMKLGVVVNNQAQSATTKVPIPVGAANVQFTKDGSLGAYYALNESGFDRTLPAGEISHDLEVIHEFVDAKGNVITRVKVGDEFWVRLRIRSTTRERVSQIAVVDLLPGGVEPTLDHTTGPGSNWTPQFVDVRDDRIVIYGDAKKDAQTYTYKVRATNVGTFQVPPAFAEGMYNRQISGMSQASKLEIVKP
jgi:alpha-2-macroglobulin